MATIGKQQNSIFPQITCAYLHTSSKHKRHPSTDTAFLALASGMAHQFHSQRADERIVMLSLPTMTEPSFFLPSPFHMTTCPESNAPVRA